ncbi:hypothetical protein GH714_018387 [Hevea brasiliensis]|uniref:Uncharacterized protein n=1 Tax=Hevea brasiliensis TaxID=3981 RepID=A0A6A6N366_HEVBR|nr:hypothetical protein GH714_018387 [Hevea brasiliensis]
MGPSVRPLLDSENSTIYLDVDEEDSGNTVDGFTQQIFSDHSSIQSNVGLPLPLETEHSVYVDAQEDMQNGVDALNRRDIIVERSLLIINFAVELPSAVFDQLSSVHKPQYALLSMLMSLATMLFSIIDLADKGRKERVEWMVRGYLPWFYSPYPNYKPLGTYSDIVGLVCGIFQWVFATTAYAFLSHHSDNPVKFSAWPLIFAFGALFSRFPRNPHTRVVVHERLEIHQCSPESPSPSPSPLNGLRALQLLELEHLPIPSHVGVLNLRDLPALAGKLRIVLVCLSSVMNLPSLFWLAGAP